LDINEYQGRTKLQLIISALNAIDDPHLQNKVEEFNYENVVLAY